MRISLNWLKELVEIKLTPEELAETLTMAGFEVEDIEGNALNKLIFNTKEEAVSYIRDRYITLRCIPHSTDKCITRMGFIW